MEKFASWKLKNRSYFPNPHMLICTMLSDQVWWWLHQVWAYELTNELTWEIWSIFQSSRCRFLRYSKNYTCTFMQDNPWHYTLFQFHLSFRTWEVWKWRGKMLKNGISPEWKELFRWHKKHFDSFWRAIIWWKNKNLIKNSRYKP